MPAITEHRPRARPARKLETKPSIVLPLSEGVIQIRPVLPFSPIPRMASNW